MNDPAPANAAAAPAPEGSPAAGVPVANVPRARWFVRGDLDGFFGLAIDNLVQLLLIDALCIGVLGFPAALVHGRILPGAAVSILVGNLFYSWQAQRLARRTGRSDVCALPYGINTVSLFAHVFLVMLPAKLEAEQLKLADPASFAWKAGLAACMGSALIELVGAFVANFIRRLTPRAALLSTLAGIALGFISLGFLFRTFAHPLAGFATLAIVLLIYFGKVRFKFGLPGGLVAVVIGSVIAWRTGLVPPGPWPPIAGFCPPVPVVGDLVDSLRGDFLWKYVSVIIPMGLFNVVASLQNIESAEAAGDAYPMTGSLAVNGLGSFAAALFGSCFPTTIYIGHPGWKALGARAGYSVANGAFVTIVCLTGSLAFIAHAIPIDAGMAIVLWIGIVITAQAFQAVPREHAPAVVIGILPGVAAWGVLLAKHGLRAAGVGAAGGPPFGPDLIGRFLQSDTWIDGGFALEQGFIFTSMILSAATVAVIERRFVKASLWCFAGSALAATGILHAYQFTPSDTVLDPAPLGTILHVATTHPRAAFAMLHGQPGWRFVEAYAAMGALFLLAPLITRKGESH
jgi:AGZA family xanthine/uracil permease-like MFS transporter